MAALGSIEDQLDAEGREDESARRQYGGRWPLAASYVASGELRDRLAAYRHAAPLSWAAHLPSSTLLHAHGDWSLHFNSVPLCRASRTECR